MAATRSTPLDPAARNRLLHTAASAIESGLAASERVFQPDVAGAPDSLVRPGASFVTLTIGMNLRGCRGTLEPQCSLLFDVWRNARASAFDDPRFPPIERCEWLDASLEVAVLGDLERIALAGESDLVRSLVPGTHGLVLAWRGSRATFLPKVWEHIGDPGEFVAQLKLKAGWPAGFWDAGIEAWRYVTETMRADRPAHLVRERATT